MTDRTQPDSASTTGSTHIIRYALELGLLWIDGDGRDKVREALDALDALEAKLTSIRAGGVQALSAAPEAFLHSVIALCTNRGCSPENIEAWDKDDKWIADLWRQAEAMLAASPTPQAEQQAPSAAAADTVVLEAALRAIHQSIDLIGEPDTDRLRLVRRVLRGAVVVAEDSKAPQPEQPATTEAVTPKAGATTGAALGAEQAAPKAAPGVGNSGFDHQTAADFLSGKTISDEAVRKFVQASRWAHDEKASLSAMLISVRGELASREAEIALLKRALMEAEAAPQQEAQEPSHRETVDVVGVRSNGEHVNLEKIAMPPRMKAREIAIEQFGSFKDDDGSDAEMCFGALEYFLEWLIQQGWSKAPQPALAPLSDDTERLNWLLWKLPGDALRYVVGELADTSNGAEFRAAIDTAIAAQGGKV